MKIIFTLLILLLIFPLFPHKAEAKLLPQVGKLGKGVASKIVSTGIIVSPRLRSDRRALIVYFSNLQNASAVSYVLTYQTSEQEEGAMGGLKLIGNSSDSVELLFGTCSKNVCRYHTGINNMHLEVPYTSKSGNKYLKKYRIKV